MGERFYRASNAVTAHIPGTGLGLRMVQAIVNNHHGSFGLSSEEGRGTTATLRLPVQPARSSGRPTQALWTGQSDRRSVERGAKADSPRCGRRWHTWTLAPVHARSCDPAAVTREETMKKDIHPEYVTTEVTCTCGNTFTTRSTATSGIIHSEVCSNCHPFYTGKQKILDTGGRVARFEARYAKKKADK